MKKLTLIILVLFYFAFLGYSNARAELIKPIILPKDKSIERYSEVLSNYVYIRLKAGTSIEAFKNKNPEVEIVKSLLLPEETALYNQALIKDISQNKNIQIKQLIKTEEPLLRTYLVNYKSNISPEIFCKQILNKNSEIEIAEPYRVAKTLWIPNDTYLSSQKSLEQIKAFDAWDLYQGDTSIVIGISDNGVDQSHEDLKNSIAANWSEIPNNNIDDDGNGYVDDYTGYNFHYKSESTSPNSTYHYDSHGTGVAGMAAATVNNSIGIAGVAFKSRIFPMKLSPNNSTSILYGYESILYSAKRKFKVINCSWGVEGKVPSALEQSIIDYAVANDVAIVAAGGNMNTNVLPTYPAFYSGVLGVGEVNFNDAKTLTSLGPHVRIMAPGDGNISTKNNNQYETVTGTSFASPVVAGAVSLVRGKYPDLSAIQALEFVRQCGDDIKMMNISDSSIIPVRLNMYKMMITDPLSIPGIVAIEIKYYNKNNEEINRFPLGDTIYPRIKIKNYLGAANNLRFELVNAYDFLPAVEMINTDINISSIANNEEKLLDGFSFVVNQSYNDKIIFKVDIYGESNYRDNFLFYFSPRKQTTTFSNKALQFSVSDRGTIGFRLNRDSESDEDGIGFVSTGYTNNLYSAGLMASENKEKLVSSLWGSGFEYNDFRCEKQFINPEYNVGIINDSDASASERIGIQIKQQFLVPIDSLPYTKVILNIKNISGRVIKDLSLGYYIDWDIQPNYRTNKVSLFPEGISNVHNPSVSIAEKAEYYETGQAMFGTSIYSAEPNIIPQAAGLTIDITEDFTKAKQIDALYNGVNIQSNDVTDISQIIAMRFLNDFQPNTTIKCEVCFGIGSNNEILANSLKNCMDKLFISVDEDINYDNNSSAAIYPNPVAGLCNFVINAEKAGEYQIDIYDILGYSMITPIKGFIAEGRYHIPFIAQNFQNGTYYVRIIVNNNIYNLKMMVYK